MNDVIFKGIWVLLGIIMLRYYAKRKHTVKSAFFGMLSGGTGTCAMHYFGSHIGFSPPLTFLIL